MPFFFFFPKYMYFKITLTIMKCEELGEFDYNSNLVKSLLRLQYTSTSFDVLPLIDVHIFVFITFSFLGPKLM